MQSDPHHSSSTRESDMVLQQNVHPDDWINPTPSGRYDLVVIGAGTAGLVTAAGAAGLGAKVALIERGNMGGDCLNTGCVPSKLLLRAARSIAEIRSAHRLGIHTGEVNVDFPAIMARMRQTRAEISVHDSAARFRSLGVDVFLGHGRFTSSHEIAVDDAKLTFRRAVIATGGRARIPDLPGLSECGYLTNDNLFSLDRLPQRLLILGAGPIGCEMACCFAAFGSQVTVVDSGDRILKRDDADASDVVHQSMQRANIRLVLSAEALRIEQATPGHRLVYTQSNVESSLEFDQILVAVGRAPNVEGLGLENAGVEFDTREGIHVDDNLRTTSRRIFAAGDVCGLDRFTHAADFMARLVIQNCLFMGRAKFSSLLIPRCTYTLPELAHVGEHPKHRHDSPTEINQSVNPSEPLDEYRMDFTSVDRAVIDDDAIGFVKVFCHRGTDKIAGATIVGENAGDLISEITMAIRGGLGLMPIASVIHPYPTRADAIRKLGDQYNRQRLSPTVRWLLETWLAIWRRFA